MPKNLAFSPAKPHNSPTVQDVHAQSAVVTPWEPGVGGLARLTKPDRKSNYGNDMRQRDELGNMHWLYKETMSRLEWYDKAVSEGRDLDAANDFARYILNSQLGRILKPFDNSGVLKVDSSFLVWSASELRSRVCSLWSRGKVAPKAEATHLESIHHKLDLIAGQLARVSSVQRIRSEPVLSVIP